MICRTYTEHGHCYSSGHTGTYKITYTQPFHRHLAAWLYHKYDMLYGRRRPLRWLGRLIERWEVHKYADDDTLRLYFMTRQDLRCYDLHQKDRVQLSYENSLHVDTDRPQCRDIDQD